MNGGMRVAAYEKSKSVKLKSISTMTEGTIWRQILLFSIPLILGNLLQQMYNTVDSIIVGNFVGSNALAAVGSSTSLICLLIAFSMGASAGAGVIVSQFYGAGDENGVQRSAHTALMLALILGIVRWNCIFTCNSQVDENSGRSNESVSPVFENLFLWTGF